MLSRQRQPDRDQSGWHARFTCRHIEHDRLAFASSVDGSAIGTNICVSTLNASGVTTIAIDSVANVTGVTTFPLISYAGASPASGNFVKEALPSGFAGHLLNNTTQKRIDLVVARNAAVTPRVNALNLLGTNLVIGGTNGFPMGMYYVLAATNVTPPFSAMHARTGVIFMNA